MFPLAAVTTGVSALGAIQGLLGGNAAAARARQAQEQAIRDMEAENAQYESNAFGSGRRGLYDLTGTLRDSLEQSGRGLGSAMAGGGVYNSSATAGALANEATSNNQTLGAYSTNLSDMLANLHSKTSNQINGLKFGLASDQLGQAQQQQAGSAGGFASLLGSLGQFNLGQKGADFGNKIGNATNGMQNGTPAAPPSALDRPLDLTQPQFMPSRKKLPFGVVPLVGN